MLRLVVFIAELLKAYKHGLRSDQLYGRFVKYGLGHAEQLAIEWHHPTANQDGIIEKANPVKPPQKLFNLSGEKMWS